MTCKDLLRPLPALAAAAIALAATGCATQELVANLPISGGGHVPIRFTPNGADHAENEAGRIEKAELQIDPSSHLAVYDFAFVNKTPGRLRSVRIDDVTDDLPVTMLADGSPTVEKRRWERRTDPFALNSEHCKWLFNIDNTILVYRFTIEIDGRDKVVMYEAFAYPRFIKAGLLKANGFTPEAR